MPKRTVRRIVAAVATTTAVVLADHYVRTNFRIMRHTDYDSEKRLMRSEAWQAGYESGKRGMWCFCTQQHSVLCPVKENSKIDW